LKKELGVRRGITDLLEGTSLHMDGGSWAKLTTADNEKQILRECRKWLDWEDPRKEYTRNRDARMQGTCNWIFEDDDFRTWMDSPSNHHLWVKGKAGISALISLQHFL
jgi:hypothetical protein